MEAIAIAPKKIQPVLLFLLDTLADLLQRANDGRYPANDLTLAQRRQRTLEAIMLELQSLARPGPVLMIFEDLHWIDPTSLELLGQLIEAIAALPVLLVVDLSDRTCAPWAARSHVKAMPITRLARFVRQSPR